METSCGGCGRRAAPAPARPLLRSTRGPLQGRDRGLRCARAAGTAPPVPSAAQAQPAPKHLSGGLTWLYGPVHKLRTSRRCWGPSGVGVEQQRSSQRYHRLWARRHPRSWAGGAGEGGEPGSPPAGRGAEGGQAASGARSDTSVTQPSRGTPAAWARLTAGSFGKKSLLKASGRRNKARAKGAGYSARRRQASRGQQQAAASPRNSEGLLQTQSCLDPLGKPGLEGNLQGGERGAALGRHPAHAGARRSHGRARA